MREGGQEVEKRSRSFDVWTGRGMRFGGRVGMVVVWSWRGWGVWMRVVLWKLFSRSRLWFRYLFQMREGRVRKYGLVVGRRLWDWQL